MKKTIMPLIAVLVLLNGLLSACNVPVQPKNISPGQQEALSPDEPDFPSDPTTLPIQKLNGLMKGASPFTSALSLHHYNGEKYYESFIFDMGISQGILDELDMVRATEAENWSLDDITLPIYGLTIGKSDGSTIYAAWSNGYWITQDGTAFIFNFDFNKLEEDNPWENRLEYDAFFTFPCEYFLTQDENGWNTRLLTPAEELRQIDDITMTLASWENETVSVNITNNSSADWEYGEGFLLQVLLDGIWYEVPFRPGPWGFLLVGHIVQSGEERQHNFSLANYSSLPAGTYRLVTSGINLFTDYDLSVEYTLS